MIGEDSGSLSMRYLHITRSRLSTHQVMMPMAQVRLSPEVLVSTERRVRHTAFLLSPHYRSGKSSTYLVLTYIVPL